MSRGAFTFLALVVTAAVMNLATGALAVRIEHPGPPRRPLQVPAWVDLGDAPNTEDEQYACAERSYVDAWSVAVTTGALQARPFQDRPRGDEWPYGLVFAHALDPNPFTQNATAHERWVATYAREHARRWIEPVIDGWLVGFDGGEYGGSLWWYPKVPGRGVKLAAENVRAIVVSPGRGAAAVFVGGAMERDEGHVLRVRRDATTASWGIASWQALRGWPVTTVEQPEGTLVGTTRSVELVSSEGVPRLLADVSPRHMLPASLVMAAGGEIVVGMPHLVIVFRPRASGYVPHWYAPLPCRVFVDDGPPA